MVGTVSLSPLWIQYHVQCLALSGGEMCFLNELKVCTRGLMQKEDVFFRKLGAKIKANVKVEPDRGWKAGQRPSQRGLARFPRV